MDRELGHVTSPLAASDSGIERHRDAIFRPQKVALDNNRHEPCEYFEGFVFSLLLL